MLFCELDQLEPSQADGSQNVPVVTPAVTSAVASGVERRRFTGKVVLITGAAGDIGGATALAFAREGATLVLVDQDHTRPQLEVQCRELEAAGAERALLYTADVRQEREVQAMVNFTMDSAGMTLKINSHTCGSRLFLHDY